MPNVVDSIKDFALPERKLFPCDTPALTYASIEAFEKESRKLLVSEKIAAARHIAKRAFDHDLDASVAKSAAVRIGVFSGTKTASLGNAFKVALGVRKEATAWKGEAVRDLAQIEKLATLVDKQVEHKPELLEKLASTINDFDKKWHTDGPDIPDAVDTVFCSLDAPPMPMPNGAYAGDRVITSADFAKLDKTAAAKKLSADGIKATESFAAFKGADYFTRTAIAEFIPEV